MSAGQVVQVDPATLLVGPNVRKEVSLDAEFKSSIKDRGVLVPITAQETPDGFVVIDGQRRTLAAVDAGVKTVPVYVTAAVTEKDRIVDQIVVNLHRDNVQESDAIAAVQELALFDMKVPAIAKASGLPKRLVEKAVAVGSSKAASKVMKAGQLSFDSAVIIAEFEEFPAEQKMLLALKQDWQIREEGTKLRRARLLAAMEAEIAAAGLPMIKEPDYSASDPIAVSRLYVDEKKQKPLGDETHERLVELAGDGLCGYASFEWVEGEQRPVIRYAVKGWKDRGLFSYYGNDADAKPTTPEDIEAAKQERRAAREATKAWVEATPARIEFLQNMVAKKTMPKGWEPYVVGRLLDDGSNGTSGTAQWRMAIAILKLKESPDAYSLRGVISAHLIKAPTHALQIALAVWLGSVEGGFEFDRKGWSQSGAKKYLEQLEAWGHVLSEAELAVVGRKKGKAAA